jgi:hypothetical protein
MAISATSSKGFPGRLPCGTAAAPPEVAGGEITMTAQRLALRLGRPRRVRLCGERAGELAARADPELGKDLA